MPPLLRSRDEPSDDSISSAPQNAPDHTDQSRVWIIVGVIAAAVFLGACAIFLYAGILRRRRMRREREQEPADDISLSQKEFSRKRTVTAEDRMQAHDRQREIMIRKSLASRSASRSSQADSIDPFEAAEAGQSGGGLRDDWKEFEARLQRENSAGRDHPALPVSRSPSPSRSPLMTGRSSPVFPPLAQRHPSQR